MIGTLIRCIIEGNENDYAIGRFIGQGEDWYTVMEG